MAAPPPGDVLYSMCENNRVVRLIDDKGYQYWQEHKPNPLA
jgi:hypothetical protein